MESPHWAERYIETLAEASTMLKVDGLTPFNNSLQLWPQPNKTKSKQKANKENPG